MKIAVDYTLGKNHIGGMGVLVRNIVKEITNLDKNNDYILFESPLRFNSKNFFIKLVTVAREHIWYQTKFLTELYAKKVDLLYSPNPPVPLLFTKPIIVNIPDMAFYYEKTISYLTRTYLLVIYYLAAQKAEKITTLSEHSKKDIQKILRVKPDKIHIIPGAASDQFRPIRNKGIIHNTLAKYNIRKPFILSTPGTFVPRKNIKDLILAVSRIPNNKLKNISVVLLGKNQGEDFLKLKKFVDLRNMTKSVIFTGYVDVKDWITLHSAAKLFVYPSLYEGFALPLLEAMKSGTPVIVYNKTSLPEVVGDAGIIVNNPKELTQAIVKLLDDKKMYSELVRKGLRRSKDFNWKESATKLNNLILNP